MREAKLKPKEERRLLRGHLWAFRNEFKSLPNAVDGDLIDVVSSQGRLVGRGFFQLEGGIAVRLLTKQRDTIDVDFFRRRLEDARTLRERLYPGQTTYRWIHGESDGLPGLVVDRYGAVVTAHTTCAFYYHYAQVFAEAVLADPGVATLRLAVGDVVNFYGEPADEVECAMDGYTFDVDLAAGQKTGLFLDQRENQRALERFAEGARVFDGHCYVGAWSIRAAKAGAAPVLGVDTSEPALERARRNAELNGVADQCRFANADVIETLQASKSEPFDVVLLDPPPFAKTRNHARKALGLYQALNRAAMEALKPGGILITSSCSHFVDEAEFVDALKRAGAQAQRSPAMLELRGAAPDHPVLLSMPETIYLKCAVLRVP